MMAEDEMTIQHAGGTIRATTLSLALSAKFSDGIAIKLLGGELLPSDIEIFNPRTLRPLADVVSVISGGRGRLAIALTPSELLRMLLQQLPPEEVKALRDRFGDIDELPLPSPDVTENSLPQPTRTAWPPWAYRSSLRSVVPR